MSYAQRAALVEPLAKASQLKVIVATTGLAAGINFAMRSVLISDNEYRVAEAHRHLRPDELLQMFGRAGRRGLDRRGYALTPPAPHDSARPARYACNERTASTGLHSSLCSSSPKKRVNHRSRPHAT